MATAQRIPVGKKRYCLTLTESTVNRMHEFITKNHAPKSMMSSIVDELLADILKTFDGLQAAQERKGSEIGMGELFSVVGKILTDKNEDQGKLI